MFNIKHTRLYVIRHGQVVGHDEQRLNGRTDVDLTPVGQAQMEAVAKDLEGVELAAVYSSDLKRARYGGEALVRSRDIELRVDPLFRELNFGQWEGLSLDEVAKKYPGERERRLGDILNYRTPGGETFQELADRIKTGVSQILSKHKDSAVALVAHSGVNRVILLQALGCGLHQIWRMEQDFGCLNIVDYFEDGYSMIKLVNAPNKVQGA